MTSVDLTTSPCKSLTSRRHSLARLWSIPIGDWHRPIAVSRVRSRPMRYNDRHRRAKGTIVTDPKVPKHYAVRDQIAELIADAAPGTALPTERELAVRFGTSRTTIRQALSALTADGRLDRTQGRGTFVAQPRLVQVRQLTSYSDDLRRQGH